MDELDRSIVNTLQDGLPLCEEPFAALAAALETDEQTIVSRLARMLDEGILSRFGPLYNAERMGGALSLCALSAAPEAFDAIAERVNAHPEVAHNYEREHALNMWFVLATEDADRIAQVVAEIEQETGCRVLQFPKQKEFFVGLKLEV
ncbi:MAG: AsnC family transcriptional regulator [Gammaproteobacteria bacterium]|nr:AsnC family transcriptional regulator [Gammaproteobacteria bacterium]NIM72606.1 AsnC family transcriptional regulator [Gammaproteobacteria bacterium]NIN37663.1 AsnC family transcriptional regulator [Gammaproteobacteria bacterium]NIO24367.1 AsnC family transcriptional regulator [Gammaproteobacteria bacterium]NIO64970.1 AsnC family transcriptional regulator [Gammaproteobacteria bacterium]